MARIDSLRIFTEVVEAGNFTNAANKLGLSPSAISKQIGLLEDRLGVRLLNRTTRTVNPTEAGQLYYERARRILEELDDAEALIADMDRIPRGTLKIAVEPIFGREILARIMASYNLAFPEVKIELVLSDHALALVKQGFDAGLHLGGLDDPALSAIELVNHNLILCASAEYLDKHGHPHSIADLSRHQLVKISSMEIHQPRQPDDYFDSLKIQAEVHMLVNDIDMAYHAVMAGSGITPLPNYLVRPQIENGNLKQLLPDISTEAQPVQLVHIKRRHLSRKTQSFLSFLKQYFQP